jgi:hypothetical protein
LDGDEEVCQLAEGDCVDAVDVDTPWEQGHQMCREPAVLTFSIEGDGAGRRYRRVRQHHLDLALTGCQPLTVGTPRLARHQAQHDIVVSSGRESQHR